MITSSNGKVPPVNSPHKGQWRGALMFSLIRAWVNRWVNTREAGELRRHRGYHDVIVIWGCNYFSIPSKIYPRRWGYSTDFPLFFFVFENRGPSTVFDILWSNQEPPNFPLGRVQSLLANNVIFKRNIPQKEYPTMKKKYPRNYMVKTHGMWYIKHNHN